MEINIWKGKKQPPPALVKKEMANVMYAYSFFEPVNTMEAISHEILVHAVQRHLENGRHSEAFELVKANLSPYKIMMSSMN